MTDNKELLGYLQICGLNSHELETARKLVTTHTNKAVIKELEKFTHSEGSIHILAERVSCQPANHDPIHTWPIINGKVIIISQDYLEERLKELRDKA